MEGTLVNSWRHRYRCAVFQIGKGLERYGELTHRRAFSVAAVTRLSQTLADSVRGFHPAMRTRRLFSFIYVVVVLNFKIVKAANVIST